MRPLVPLLGLLAALCVGGQAWAAISASGAPTPDRRTIVRTPQPPAADKAAKAKTAKALPVLAAAKPLASPLPADVGQCRLDCARSYYFCLAGDDADSCGPTWASCLSACNAPAPTAP